MSSHKSSLQSQWLATGIFYAAEQKSWLLTTEESTYALGISPEGILVHQYWGRRLASATDLPLPQVHREHGSQDPGLTLTMEEYPPFGGLRYGETVAKATFSDGTRDLDLRFSTYQITEIEGLPELHIILHDAVYPLEVLLTYRVDTANDLIIRSASFSNKGAERITLERAFSAAWHLPRQFEPRRITSLAGKWLSETRLQERKLVPGSVVLENLRGISGASIPWFAIDAPGTEYASELYFGTLAWSGNWTLHINTSIWGATAITGGIHDFDFAWQLQSGESFTTPEFVAGFANDGFNGSRHRLHRYIRQHVLPAEQARQPRPVLYNSWEATLFDVNEEGQIALAERAAKMGVELFVMDDGWFPARITDNAGLGDWRVDPVKFPNGLLPLVERVKALGMQFGIWVEPEMVNPDSDLYRAHPDWVYHFPLRPRNESRQQLVLNVGRADVQAYLLDILSRLVAENGIDFIKWDMNRPISEPGWPEYVAQGGDARELWVRHVEGVYAIMDGLRQRHPQLAIESCASGGHRADLGILRRTDQVWTSDNTHPDARLFIQEGSSLILPGRVMSDWVTDSPNDRRVNEIPLSFRFHVAMMGMLGIGGHLLHWSDEDLTEAAHWIALYKQIRHLVQDGDQYWLLSPTATEGVLGAVECVAPDASEAVVFAYRRMNPFQEESPRLRLQGLRPETLYHINNGQQAQEEIRSGASLMHYGLQLPLGNSSYASCVVHLKAQ
ncbi:alpha-galactosidase [Tengunoibacter tsumagoiensis]|uniref:Alpha-galactosidase n=1 Tax=Tengunoibacter tsumagoiensis TaxID=2014871 RepID=A0A402AAR8_9CHLR|nr:alpha-galactosidase [Tengunoibacter tsumagoiensis]GCE16198.1 alpha-galactosidase [Tengunoibacter tsumagoiensis]